MKIQIYTSYDIVICNIKPQNGFVFHMYVQVAIECLVQLANYVQLPGRSNFYIAIGVLKILHE